MKDQFKEQFDSYDLIIDFWTNLPNYINNDTVIQKIDETFPQYFVDNYNKYQEMFNNLAKHYETYFFNLSGDIIDFTINYADAFRFIIKGLKDTYIEHKDLIPEDVEDILHDMYYEKYNEFKKNNLNILDIIDILKYGQLTKNLNEVKSLD